MDGTRSLHAGPANSGLWSLTYSVFGAITAASTLASGSVLIPSRKFLTFDDKVLSVVGYACIKQWILFVKKIDDSTWRNIFT